MAVVHVRKTVSMEIVQKVLQQRRNYDEFVALAFGPAALAAKPIVVTPEQLKKARMAFTPGQDADGRQAFIPSIPVLRLWLRENPRQAKKLRDFIDAKLASMNGAADHAEAHVSVVPSSHSAVRRAVTERKKRGKVAGRGKR